MHQNLLPRQRRWVAVDAHFEHVSIDGGPFRRVYRREVHTWVADRAEFWRYQTRTAR